MYVAHVPLGAGLQDGLPRFPCALVRCPGRGEGQKAVFSRGQGHRLVSLLRGVALDAPRLARLFSGGRTGYGLGSADGTGRWLGSQVCLTGIAGWAMPVPGSYGWISWSVGWSVGL